MKPHTIIVALTLLCSTVRAQFVDYYSLTPPAPGYYMIGASRSFGNWRAMSTGGTYANLSTFSTASFALSATSDAAGNPAEASLLILPESTGTISFDWQVFGSAFVFGWTNDGGATYNFVSGVSGTLEVPVVATADFGFYVRSPASSAAFGNILVSNFSSSAIPEPAVYSMALGIVAVALALYRKRRLTRR